VAHDAPSIDEAVVRIYELLAQKGLLPQAYSTEKAERKKESVQEENRVFAASTRGDDEQVAAIYSASDNSATLLTASTFG